MMHKK